MINFSKVEQSVRELKYQVATGKINQQTFEAHLMELVDIAPDGYYWMFGHQTEMWYQHDGQQWIAKDPGKLRLLIPQDKYTANPEPVEPVHPPAPPNEQTLSSAWRSINWAWLVVSLITLGLIASIIFSSSSTF